MLSTQQCTSECGTAESRSDARMALIVRRLHWLTTALAFMRRECGRHFGAWVAEPEGQPWWAKGRPRTPFRFPMPRILSRLASGQLSKPLLKSTAVGFAILAQYIPTYSSETTILRPFVGETTQEFEARKRGVPVERESHEGGALTVPADASGHFFVEPTLAGQRIRMLVDTGASVVTLSHEDAEQLSLRVSSQDFTSMVSTANGVVEAAPVRIAEIQIGDISVRDVDALVLPPGRLKTSLLGMTFLRRLSTFEISGGRLVLRQ